MSVDPTFKLGKFNVTPISYRNLTLSTHHDRCNNPIAIGPMPIHFSKTEQIYSSFFQTLLRLRPGLSSLKAYGTDGETPLCKALASNSSLLLYASRERERVKPWSQDWLIAAGTYPGFCSMKQLGVFLLPLYGMPVHRTSLPSNLLRFPNNLPVPIYTPRWREALRE